LRAECDLSGEIALAHQGMLFLGEIREIPGIMAQTDPKFP
jgi:predicted ATPase with chaperone activity